MAVTAYFSSKQLLPFGFAQQSSPVARKSMIRKRQTVWRKTGGQGWQPYILVTGRELPKTVLDPRRWSMVDSRLGRRLRPYPSLEPTIYLPSLGRWHNTAYCHVLYRYHGPLREMSQRWVGSLTLAPRTSAQDSFANIEVPMVMTIHYKNQVMARWSVCLHVRLKPRIFGLSSPILVLRNCLFLFYF